jgi:serralysin
MVSVVNPIGNNDIDGILWGWKWDSTNITFSFPTGTAEYAGYEEINGFQAFNATQQTAVRNILANVASFTNLTFTETTAAGAILRYAEADSINYTDDPDVAGHDGLHTIDTAEANPPELAFGGDPPFAAPYAQGDSWYNHTSYNNSVPGSFGYAAGIMHETGHNLGLKHGHDTQEGHGVIFPELPPDHNSYEYSVMTYQQFPGDTGASDNAPDHPTTFMQNDIAALQYMYGANYNFNSGNTTYTWSTTTGQSFVNGVGGLTPDANFILMTIWDGGGIDTYDFSNYSTDIVVDLRPGAWIDLNTQIANLGDNGAGGPTYFARGNIANAQVDPNNPSETLSFIERAIGGTGDDQITGNSVNNTLKGGGGDDTLAGLDGNDLLEGDAGDDTLKGAGGADSLYGGADDDGLKGGGGADYLNGGNGIDTASYALSTAGVNVDLGEDTASGGDAAGDELDNIENLTGSDHNDTLAGDGNVNILYGGEGDDLVKGAGGADDLDGGIDTDTASYFFSSAGVSVSLDTGTGFGGDAEGDTLDRIENLWGSEHDDFLAGDAGANTLLGFNGDDTLKGGGGADDLDGGNGDDTASYLGSTAGVSVSLATGNGSFGFAAGDTLANFENLTGSVHGDNLYGDTGANRLKGAGGSDYLYGANGDDTLDGGAGGDTLDGWNGSDTATYSGSDAGVTINLLAGTAAGGYAAGDALFRIENVEGSNHNDTLTGDGGANTLDGLSGDDTVLGGAGADDLDGGAGANDTVSYAGSGAGVTVDLGANTASGGDAAGDTIANFERVLGSSFADTLTGSAANNRLDGSGGADIMTGGAGDDTYVVNSDGDDVNENAGEGTDEIRNTITLVLPLFLENMTMIGGAAIDGTGNNLANIMIGNFADNELNGGSNNDRLDGNVGADIMRGGGGADTYAIDQAGDQVIEDAVPGTDTVECRTLLNYTLTPNVERLYFLGPGNFVGRGNALDNYIAGNAGTDRFVVDAAGADTYNGGGSTDIMDFRPSLVGAIVNLTTGVHGGAAAGDVYSSIETFYGSDTAGDQFTGNGSANRFDGYGGDDVLNGMGGDDTLNGGDGLDTLIGGTGMDFMTGGADADTFDFNATNESSTAAATRDRVLDFIHLVDIINVLDIDARENSDGNNIFTFIGVAAFSGEGQIRAQQSGAHTVLEFNTDGLSVAEMTVQLNGVTAATLTGADFVL